MAKNQRIKFANKALDIVKRYPMPSLTASEYNERTYITYERLLCTHRELFPGLYTKMPRKQKKSLKKALAQRHAGEDAIIKDYFVFIKIMANSRYGSVGQRCLPSSVGHPGKKGKPSDPKRFILGIPTTVVIKCKKDI